MQSDADILQRVQQAFAGCRRPEHFTDYTHCEECAEHDEVLHSRDIDTLQIEDAGNPGWDPVCFTTSEGFVYYFLTVARLALAESDYAHGWYGTQLLFHLVGDGCKNRRFLDCTSEQRRAVFQFLQHLLETGATFADEHCSTDNLFQALEIWSDEIPVA
ncbi:hypothetical protein [Immundisolibacter sp.]